MNSRARIGVVLAATTLLMAGCASTSGRSTSSPPSNGQAAGHSSASKAPGAAAMADMTADGVPSAAEKMVCAPETRTTIKAVLGLQSTPIPTATWAQHTYTCRYRLPMGSFVVSVHQSADHAAAKRYFADLRPTLDTTKTLAGLGQGSYGTDAGKVVLMKDNDTLIVDATALPPVFGRQQSRPAGFAYEIASDILGCWTGG